MEVDRRYQQFQAVIARNSRDLADLKSLVLARLGSLGGTPDGYRPGDPVYILSDDTFTKATYPTAVAFLIELVGGGGAGGGAATTGAGESSVGTGGNGADYALAVVLATDLDTSEAVTVGTGGTGVSGAAGNDGEDTVFDTISGEVRAAGGQSGSLLGTGSAAAVGTVSTVNGTSTGDLVAKGGAGDLALRVSGQVTNRSRGGSSIYAGMTIHVGNNSAGEAGQYPGGGGSGGLNVASQGTARAGGAGANGIAIVTPLY